MNQKPQFPSYEIRSGSTVPYDENEDVRTRTRTGTALDESQKMGNIYWNRNVREGEEGVEK